MELPICYFCARTKVLCPKDQKRLEGGEITELDVDIAHELVILKEKKYPQLDRLSFKKAVRIDENTFLLVRNSFNVEKRVLFQVARTLSSKGYGRVRFVEQLPNIRDLVEQILYPVRVQGVDIIWLPDGTSEYNVRINKLYSRRLPFPKSQAEKIIEHFAGKRVRISFS